jgi:hypothetical protein
VIARAEFVHAPSDLVALHTLFLTRGPARLLGPISCAVLFGLTFGVAAGMTRWPGGALWPVPLAIALGSGLGFALSRLVRAPCTWLVARLSARLALWAAKRDGLLVAQQLTLEPAGLRAASSKGETFVRWSGVREIVCHQDVLFFFVSRRTAFMIPRRAFQTDAEFERYRSAAMAMRSAGPA